MARAEQRPGHRVQNRRFAGPVGPGDAGQVDAVEVENGRVPVRKKVSQFKSEWNHLFTFHVLRSYDSLMSLCLLLV